MIERRVNGNQISDLTKSILLRQLNVEPEKIQGDASIVSDLGADSLDLAEIALMIKDELQYDLKENEIAQIKTVRDLVNLLEKRLSPK